MLISHPGHVTSTITCDNGKVGRYVGPAKCVPLSFRGHRNCDDHFINNNNNNNNGHLSHPLSGEPWGCTQQYKFNTQTHALTHTQTHTHTHTIVAKCEWRNCHKRFALVQHILTSSPYAHTVDSDSWFAQTKIKTFVSYTRLCNSCHLSVA